MLLSQWVSSQLRLLDEHARTNAPEPVFQCLDCGVIDISSTPHVPKSFSMSRRFSPRLQSAARLEERFARGKLMVPTKLTPEPVAPRSARSTPLKTGPVVTQTSL
ncbi:hypothetical protein JMJ77_0004433 [Colletotrichum scovillei]|uniref:Uncharacterized protein n=1 Tax=Colletotrichum scovillei TaxID=1209932 RepID=A0A9P7QX22_9PEZI|nr:hypothetical protein JMJ77_0004433 [Colletotrichum scovillei]KAG7049691.1 hypothetical protein JMJ78_0013670 [Colletotrichum scovillei]KAG7064429.1 hypothetical protein JMJ76_0007473 [Colletotrichum scovillei]